MAIINFISTVWSENLLKQLDKKYIGVLNCNREFEGDIKNQGSIVKICGVGDVTVSDYTRNTDMSAPETLSDTVRTLKIDQAKYFNFQIDDVDRAQSNPKLMDEAMKPAAAALANAADAYVYSLYEFSNYSITDDAVTAEKIVDHIIDLKTQMMKADVLNSDEIVVEVSPEIAALILKAKIELGTDNSDALESGLLGKIAGCKVIEMVSPPSKDGKINPVILAAAKIAGVDKIFKVGGAQAVAALAYGTESIPKVDKIVGPGNAFVAENGYMLAYSECFSMEEQLIVADVDVELLLAERQSRNTFDMGYDVRKFALTNLDVASNASASVDRYIDPMPFVPEESQSLSVRCEEVFSMQTFGLAKRLKHTSCKSAVIGISGGLDSTLALLVAVAQQQLAQPQLALPPSHPQGQGGHRRSRYSMH